MKNFKLLAISIVAVIGVIIARMFLINAPQNTAIMYEEQINAAKADITVQEKRRDTLIKRMVDTVKEYDEHEYDTLLGVIEARTSDNSDNVSVDGASNIVDNINAVAEQYPELKSNENYQKLLQELSITENKLADYRENYNSNVEQYRRYVRSYPTRIFLDITGYVPIAYKLLEYEIEEDTDIFD